MHIKSYLIFGVCLQIFFSILENIFLDSKYLNLTFSSLNVLSSLIFLNGLLQIDNICKSNLFVKYAALILIGIGMKAFNMFSPDMKIFTYAVNLIFVVLFLWVLWIYLNTFSKVSGIALFNTTFWVLILCFVLGSSALLLNLVRDGWVSAFIIGFMYIPALVVYMSAIFNFDRFSLKKRFE